MNDTCPHCLRRNNPPITRSPKAGGTLCRYRCRCGQRWTTTWRS